jgi:hypothetical protein
MQVCVHAYEHACINSPFDPTHQHSADVSCPFLPFYNASVSVIQQLPLAYCIYVCSINAHAHVFMHMLYVSPHICMPVTFCYNRVTMRSCMCVFDYICTYPSHISAVIVGMHAFCLRAYVYMARLCLVHVKSADS